MEERAIADAMQYVSRRVDDRRAFSFGQWSTEVESETLHRLGARAIDFAPADVRPFRAVMEMGGIIWFGKGEDSLRWMPVRKQYLRLKAPPRGWDLQMGSLQRVVFERDGRFIWINPKVGLYDHAGLAQWSRLGEVGDEVVSPADWETCDVQAMVIEEAKAAMQVDLPTSLQRMTKGALVGLGWQQGVSLHMGMKKKEMIDKLGGK